MAMREHGACRQAAWGHVPLQQPSSLIAEPYALNMLNQHFDLKVHMLIDNKQVVDGLRAGGISIVGLKYGDSLESAFLRLVQPPASNASEGDG